MYISASYRRSHDERESHDDDEKDPARGGDIALGEAMTERSELARNGQADLRMVETG